MVMKKNVAVLAVNPVNGAGLFQYLEAFFESGIGYRVYAVAESSEIKTNSGYEVKVDDVVGNLVGNAADFDALVFACGDAVPVFAQHADEPFNRDMMKVIREFADKGKILAGHCAAALIFGKAGVLNGRSVSVHPMAAPGVQGGVVSDTDVSVDSGLYTARDEKCLCCMLPALVEKLLS